ncbi:MAG TPA: alpha/beta fold hydrolase [Acidimicrobiia bacterium]
MADRTARTGALTRRDMLRGSLTAGGALFGATALPGRALAAVMRDAPPAAPPAPAGLMFFSDPGLDFNARFALGAAGYGSAETGEVLTAINTANEAGGTLPAFVDAFWALADRTATFARRERAAGHRVTAREAYLRASEYYAQVLFFILGTAHPEQEPQVFAKVRANWEAYAWLAEPRIEKVNIPYGTTTMPGYFMRPDDSGKARPTVIVNNGSDAQTVEVFPYGGAAAIERGYNALLFEGPGQGAMLFERKIPFRSDWEKVITPIVDWLRKRSDVDKKRIALTGWSLGGELVVRAAAFEHRLAALVPDPGCTDIWAAWPAIVRDVANEGDAATQNQVWQQLFADLTPEDAFNIKKRSEIFATQFLDQARAGQLPTDYALLSTTIQRFNCVDVASRVRCPTLVTSYELEQFVPGQAQQLSDLLRSRKDLASFTVAQGAQYHCAPMAPQYRNEVVFDWLDETLRPHKH